MYVFPAHVDMSDRIRMILVITLLLIGPSLLACSRSPWIRTDGREATPSDQLECAEQIHKRGEGEALDQETLEKRVEQCMLDRGYKRRPWWLFNDLHWHIKEPAM